MALNVQYSVIGGRLTKKPELKQTNAGSVICAFTIAVNLGSGQDKYTEFNECIACGKTAENIARYFDKGDEIQVVCTKGWRTREWTGKDGSKHYKTEHRVNDFSFVGTKNLPTNQVPTPVAENAAGAKYAAPTPTPTPNFEEMKADDLDSDLPF